MAYGYLTAIRKSLNKGKKKKPIRNLNKNKIYKYAAPKKKVLVKGISARKPTPLFGLISRSEALKKGGPVKTKNIKLLKK